MGAYIARRVLALIPLLIIVSFIVFSLSQLLPGDPARVIAGGQKATPEGIAKAREELHLDKPFVQQYGIWLGNARAGRPRDVVLRPRDGRAVDRAAVPGHAVARARRARCSRS